MLPWMADFEPIFKIAAMAIAAYLVGSVNISILASRLFGLPDPRLAGSRNPGATNFLRVAGWRFAVPVLALDVAKASGIIAAAGLVGPAEMAPMASIPLLLGNFFPLFHGFKGGKGVAAAVGAFLVISPGAMLVGGGIFALMTAVGRRVSLGSLAMVASYPVSIWALGGSRNTIAAAVTTAVFIFLTHRSNIRRLVQGREPKIGERKAAPE